MIHDDGIKTFPRTRSLKELKSVPFDDDTFSTATAPSRRRAEVSDLKIALNEAMFGRESSTRDVLRRPPRPRSRYDPRRNTTGLTEYEIRMNETSKLKFILFLMLSFGYCFSFTYYCSSLT